MIMVCTTHSSTRWLLGAALSLFFVLTGCTHPAVVVKVRPSDTPAPDGSHPRTWGGLSGDVPGIPFYVKQGVCQKATTWLEPQYVLTLSVAVDGDPALTHTLQFSRAGYLSDDVKPLLSTVSKITGKYTLKQVYEQACPSKIGSQWDAVARAIASHATYQITDGLDLNGGLALAETQKNVIRVKNTATFGVAVDYTHQYYLNAKSPWIGSGQVDAKLSDDGTLGEGSGQINDQTWSTILGTVSSLVGDITGVGGTAAAAPAAAAPAVSTAEFQIQERRDAERRAAEKRDAQPAKPSCPASPGWPTPDEKVTYSYELKTNVYQHDHTDQTFDLSGGCSPETNGVLGGSFIVSLQNSDGPDSKKRDANTIEFGGSIKLPKAEKKKSGGAEAKNAGKAN
jgi:hypothetical protein